MRLKWCDVKSAGFTNKALNIMAAAQKMFAGFSSGKCKKMISVPMERGELMADKKLIDVNVLTDEIEKTNWYHINKLGDLTLGANSQHIPLFKADDIFEVLEQAPIVDAVEVVRCKYCSYWDKAIMNKNGFLICPASGMEIIEDDFCSYGERRVNG